MLKIIIFKTNFFCAFVTKICAWHELNWIVKTFSDAVALITSRGSLKLGLIQIKETFVNKMTNENMNI